MFEGLGPLRFLLYVFCTGFVICYLDIGGVPLAVLPRHGDGGEQSVGVVELATL